MRVDEKVKVIGGNKKYRNRIGKITSCVGSKGVKMYEVQLYHGRKLLLLGTEIEQITGK